MESGWLSRRRLASAGGGWVLAWSLSQRSPQTALRTQQQHGRGGRVGQDLGPADGPEEAPGHLGTGPPGEPGLGAPGQQWFPVPASGALEVRRGAPVGSQEAEGGGWGGVARLPHHQPGPGVAWPLREAGAGVCLPGLGTQQVGGRARSSLSLPGSGGVGGAVCLLPAVQAAESLPAGHLQASRGPCPGAVGTGWMAFRLWQTLFTAASPRFLGGADSGSRVGLCPALQMA